MGVEPVGETDGARKDVQGGRSPDWLIFIRDVGKSGCRRVSRPLLPPSLRVRDGMGVIEGPVLVQVVRSDPDRG